MKVYALHIKFLNNPMRLKDKQVQFYTGKIVYGQNR